MADPEQPAAEEPPTTMADASPSMERVFAAGALVFGVLLLVAARSITLRNETGGIDPRTWPTAIAIAILVAAGWVAFNALTKRRAERGVEPATRSGWIKIGIVLALTVAVLVVWKLGLSFLVLGPVYLLVLNWVFGLRSWRGLALFPVIMAALLFLIFFLVLKVPL